MALASSFLSPVMYTSQSFDSDQKVDDGFSPDDANESAFTPSPSDSASDTSESISEPEEYLADSFLRDHKDKKEPLSEQAPLFGESPEFFKFFLPSPINKPVKRQATETEPIETKKPKLDELNSARLAHQNLRKKNFLYEDLKLNSRKLKKDNEISVLGSLFQKVLSWSTETTPRTHQNVPNTSPANDSSLVETESCVVNREEEGIVHLGLTRLSVTKTHYFNKSMRSKAQETLFQGKKNVAFLDKVEVLEIPLLRKMPRSFKSRMFYTRSEFVDMIARNLKQMELEARRRQRRRRKRELLKR